MFARLRKSEAGWSLMDQAAVSGGNFLTALVLARTLSPASYGTFSLLFLSLFAINTCHSSLVVYPLTLKVATTSEGDLWRINGTALVHTLALGIPLSGVLAVVAFALHRLDLWPILAITMVGWQAQETARRVLLAGLRSSSAFLPDLVCYVGQGILLAVLRPKNLVYVFLIIAATSIIVAVWQFLIVRISLAGAFALDHCKYAWRVGGYILAGNAMNMATLQVPSWTLALMAGTSAVAGYQSLLNLVGVANPIIFSVSNLLIPAVARGSLLGVAEARRTMYYYGSRYGLLLLPGFLALAIAPHRVMRLVYGASSPYLHLAPLLGPFVLAFALQYLATVVGAYEGGMERPKTYMWVQVAGTGALLTLGIGLIHFYGIAGAVTAMVIASAARLLTFIVLSRAADRRLLMGEGAPGGAPKGEPLARPAANPSAHACSEVGS